jgi:hypothetical protein
MSGLVSVLRMMIAHIAMGKVTSGKNVRDVAVLGWWKLKCMNQMNLMLTGNIPLKKDKLIARLQTQVSLYNQDSGTALGDK